MSTYNAFELDAQLVRTLRYMQSVDEYREVLNGLQTVWDNLTLLGQLSGTGIDMTGTRQAFQQLNGSLLNQLGKEIMRKSVQEMTSKAQVAIDILVRNLFERTADIGFLATDEEIRAVLRLTDSTLSGEDAQSGDREKALPGLRERFAEYVGKYSVYFDVVLLSPQGEILVRLDDQVSVSNSVHPLILESIETTDAYVETFDRVDFLPAQSPSLIYSYRVADEAGQVLGVLCLCFRFENEMERIFAGLVSADDWSVVTLLDHDGHVIASSDAYHIPTGAKLTPVLDAPYRIERFAGQEYLATTRRSVGYQGYFGPAWYGHVMLPLQHAFDRDSSRLLKDIPQDVLDAVMQRSELFGESLREIPRKADRIQRDLNRSVWNGNIRQRRSTQDKDSGFSKVLLWEVSNTGARTKAVFQRSIANLNETVVSSVLEDSRFQASLAIDIMDRNLYERANDCRWWALTPTFRETLSAGSITEEGQHAITQILRYINSLYTVYTNLIVFDAQGRILAVSNETEQTLVGQIIEEEWYKQALELPDTQGYVVSEFARTRFYGDRHTYIYAAAIRAPDGKAVVGGIGIVFDSEPQFAAMLREALPQDASGKPDASNFAVFVSRAGHVVACSDQSFNVGEAFPVASKIFDLPPGHAVTDVMAFDQHFQATGSRASSGYREYKSEADAYRNEVIAIVCKRLCTMATKESQTELRPPSIHSERTQTGQTIEIATFRIGDEWFGMRASEIAEAIDSSTITPVPGAGSECFGYLMYDGLPIPIFDIQSVLKASGTGTSHANPQGTRQVVIVEKSSNTRFGILVDALGEIPEIGIARLNVLPASVCGGAILADAAIAPDNPDSENLLLVLNAERLFKRFSVAVTERTLTSARALIEQAAHR